MIIRNNQSVKITKDVNVWIKPRILYTINITQIPNFNIEVLYAHPNDNSLSGGKKYTETFTGKEGYKLEIKGLGKSNFSSTTYRLYINGVFIKESNSITQEINYKTTINENLDIIVKEIKK